MSSLENLFFNFNHFDLTQNKSINELANEYNANKLNLNIQTPGLTQGEKFKNYQQKIKKNLEKRIYNVNTKEGFEGIQDFQDKLKLSPNGLTVKSNNIIQNTDYSSQEQTIDNLKQHYQSTLSEYENLIAKIRDSTTGYLNRVNPNNPYLNKTVLFTTGQIAYVTNQGSVKYIETHDIWNSVNVPHDYIKLSIPWDNSWTNNNNVGAQIPTNPPLIVGTYMIKGQSLGSEGSNVFVNKLINNSTSTYKDCYADDTTSSLMTFIGETPPPPTTLQNGDFSQPQIANDSAEYADKLIPGWKLNCGLLNNSTAWGYPIPYPVGNQCVSVQKTQDFWSDWIYLSAGVKYTLSLSACGRNCCDGSGLANPINIGLDGENTIYTLNPSLVWGNYTIIFTAPTSGKHRLSFNGTWTSGDRSTAIQNIKLNAGSSTNNGSYTYDQCQQAAIDNEYKYFALQNVNTTTSKGYCAVSNSEPSVTSLGKGMIASGQQALWSSNTAKGETDNPGSTASLTNTGSLSVFNLGGQTVFSTPNSTATPSNYLGCYDDRPDRALPLYNNGSQEYDLKQCEQIAKSQPNITVFGIQNSSSGTTAQCGLGTSTSALKYGKVNNCTKLSDGSYSGGGWSNAVYNLNEPNSNYFLIIQDDGNLCIYRGTGPSDNQGSIWCAMTQGKQQLANPNYVATNGKYGKNWITNGSTLAAGDFVGSTNGNMALIMQPDGNLVLNTFTMVSNCQKMSDGNMGGGVGANALYSIDKVGVKENISKLAYIDENSKLHSYPSTNTQYSNSYTKILKNDSAGNDIWGTAYGNATVESCETTCNKTQECSGFSFGNNVCYPKNSNMYPNGEKQINQNFDLYIRGKNPITPPIGVPKNINNIDTITYQNYNNGGALENEYGLANATSTQKQQLSQLQTQMNLLSSQISELTNKFDDGTNKAQTQSKTNVNGIQNYLQGIKTTNKKINNFNTNIENILNDSDIVVLQKNYDYLFWSILAAGTVLVTMNIVKNK